MLNSSARPAVNNSIYDELGESWYESDKNPVAFLRAEAKLKNPWVAERIKSHLGAGSHTVLDIGCGAGFLSNDLARLGHRVTGLDASASSLDIARRYDESKSVHYEIGDAYALPFKDASFDVVCQMDFLEHVEDPARAIREASRVLKPGGAFFFHTFNRNFWSELIVIRLMEWFVPGTPKDMHVIHLFITPEELEQYCESAGMEVKEWRGIRPRILSGPGLEVLLRRRVSPDFQFSFTKSLQLGYLGLARRT